MNMYHYTDINGFISILQHRKLWLTSASSMNDHQEVYWFKNLFHNTLRSLINQGELTDTQLDMLNAFWMTQVNTISNPYICCFSENGDLLSQWRAYADDASGVSIGFNSRKFNLSQELPRQTLMPGKNISLNSVIYEISEQEKIINEFTGDLIAMVKNTISASEMSHDGHELFSNLANKCLAYSYIFKNPAFSEEREIRIIHLPMLDNNDKWFGCQGSPKFRASGGTIASYFDFEFLADSISEIILGPKSSVNQHDMNVFLRSVGLRH